MQLVLPRARLLWGHTYSHSLGEGSAFTERNFKLPPLKEGHRYRIRVNDGDHVGAGGGYQIYINGRPLAEATHCVGRGGGGQPKGAFITKDFIEDFRDGQVTIALKTFLRFNDKYKVKPSEAISQGKISIHMEEQKLPPMGDDMILKSARVVPFLNSQWQAAQDPNDRERQSAAAKFHYEGKFILEQSEIGVWKTLGVAKTIQDFQPDQRLDPRRGSLAYSRTQGQRKDRSSNKDLV